MNRVVREEFFTRFSEEHAVQYFYEPFLQAFDPELRKELGVWYTSQEIVEYMVERVNRVLIEEFGLPDGLADESVYVLDPACGTGAYLVEVLRRIDRTLVEKGEDATRGQKMKRAVQSRVFGFEILPAPFVVSHLQIGLLLEQLGVGLSDELHERAGVFLTNSLTGWDEHPKTKLPFPEFEEERERADRVKKEAKILVILGNPPYNVREARATELGETTYDIFLNDFAYWRNVPEKVWNYYIGGYQVIKKWLSYREIELLGRPLKLEEIAEVTEMIRRIAAIILLEKDLNENYRRTRAEFFKTT